MKKISLIIIWLFFTLLTQAQSFEGTTVPSSITVPDGKSVIAISSKYFKDGAKSLHWGWTQSRATLKINDAKISESANAFNKRGGITFWIFNETAQNKPLVFNFKDNTNTIQYTFDFYLNFTGWRAGWIAYSDMWTVSGGATSQKNITSLEIITPETIPNGQLWIDRMTFTNRVDRQATPDAQIPDNNRHIDREIWHWGLLHKWEQTEYDITLFTSLSAQQSAEINTVYQHIKNQLKGKSLSKTDKTRLNKLEAKFAISDNGKTGAPLIQKDNLIEGDVSYGELNQLLDLSSRGWYIDNNPLHKVLFVKAVRYMLNQGFAYESGMGTNHHYGYSTRKIYGAIWWMEQVLRDEKLWEEARKAITYWSGLQETRLSYNPKRDELTDSWNTLTLPRLACAMMMETKEERFRAISALSRWINGSLTFTPGTIGGIKIDGTAFHHGGHYPAYAIPGYAYIGQYLKSVNGTQFTLNQSAREVFKFALLSAARQTNLRDWGIGVSGRHPFHGNINKNGVLAYAYAAQAFEPIDHELAGEYLRLMDGLRKYSVDNYFIQLFTQNGITKNNPPVGFYVYNYTSQGIYRYHDKMVSLKGFTRNIWGSEIYYRDNRFGRYQSYGSVQIIGTKTPESINEEYPITEKASRYIEDGWDWNRNPGVTSIHLPLSKLNSPFSSSLMMRQPEKFAGASRLENGTYGMFAMKLGERMWKNFTPSFKAHKSVFCFGNKVICLGSAISNTNTSYPTETTLFQQALLSQSEIIEYNGNTISQFPYSHTIYETSDQSTVIKDLAGHYYYIPKGQEVVIGKKNQNSWDNKLKGKTNGNFAFAYLNHDSAPSNEGYEYMILFDASTEEISKITQDQPGYSVLLKNETAHIVQDTQSGARGYAIFDNFEKENDNFVLQSDKELMIMLRPKNNTLHVSVCDPDLNIGAYAYTISTPSKEKIKQITLRGKYNLPQQHDAVKLTHDDTRTIIEATCKDGIPLEFTLTKDNSDIQLSSEDDKVKIYDNAGNIVIDTIAQGDVTIFDVSGRNLYATKKKVQTSMIIPFSQRNIIVRFVSNNKHATTKIIKIN